MANKEWKYLTLKCDVCRFLKYCSSTYQFECKLPESDPGAQTTLNRAADVHTASVAYAAFEKAHELKNPFESQVGGSHYKKEGLMDVTEWCMRHKIPFSEGNVVKYVYRHKNKNGIEDLRKAKHYLEFIAFIDYGENL